MDLIDKYEVNRVVIHNRVDICCAARIDGVQVLHFHFHFHFVSFFFENFVVKSARACIGYLGGIFIIDSK